MSVEIKNLAEFDAAVTAWFAAVEEAIAEAAVGLAHEAFEEILETGPQYSGDFVANTRVSVGTPDTTFEPYVLGRPARNPFYMGAPEAQDHARHNAHWPQLKLGQTLYISSSALHDEAYSWKIENGEIALRDVNRGGDHIYARAAAYVAHRYTNIGPVQLDILRKFGA